MSDTGILKVGRASAGSGKTYTLTIEYITLLIENPENYRHILAVTFTNKATNEMKSRIIETLHGIANNDSNFNKFLQKLIEKFHGMKKEEDIRKECKHTLSLILHDYSKFRIETIDSFFQSIIRELARELNLTANLRIDLDQDEALEDAVQQMIERMKKGDDVYNAVLSYVQDNLNTEDKNWKIDSEVVKFSRNIFNENYLKEEKVISEKTQKPGFYSQYKDSLYRKLNEIDSMRIDNAQSFMNYCEQYGFISTAFIKGKSGVYAFFPKIIDGTTPKIPAAIIADSDADWMVDPSMNAIHKPKYLEFLDNELEYRRRKSTVTAILKHVNQMSLLGSVDSTIRRLNAENNRFILADTAHKLNDIISYNDIPFIYEKAASSFKYIMIDEFQDTSELQWKNFIPLIKECIGNGYMCLIVGDVKQSIYRWRNSDWGILNNINNDKYFKDVIEENEMKKALGTNHRSAGNIVKFNNLFFQQAHKDVTRHYEETFHITNSIDDITNAYNEVCQLIEENNANKGYVDIIDVKAHSKKESSADIDDEVSEDYVKMMLDEVESTIKDLKYNRGVKDSDIAILTRSNKELQLISNHLKQQIPKIKIVSDEAYQLDSSEAISILIMAMQVVAGYNKIEYQKKEVPFNRFLCATLAYRYQELICNSSNTTLHIENCFQTSEDELYKLLPKDFIKNMEELQSLPVYELCERLFNIFNLERMKNQSAHLFYFMDELSAYVEDKAADIDGFIDYWKEKLYKKTIPSGCVNGMQLMTIHKSKGLEFHTVIVPFCDWEMGGKPSIIWCKSKDGQIPITPVKFAKELENTDFKSDYEKEELKNYVDNLNLLYVAFTRASQNLIVMTGERKKAYSAYDVIYKVKNAIKDNCSLPLGQIIKHKDDKDKRNTNKPKNIEVDFINTELQTEFKQSNRSKDFIIDEENVEDNNKYYIKKGLIVHKIFEMISNEHDIDNALRQLEQEGVMQDKRFSDDVKQFINNSLMNNEVKKWFEPKWTVMNECNIIVEEKGNAHSRRPDRVIYDDNETIVVDYKTGKWHKGHIKQVEYYIQQLQKMGMPNVHGYLWYMKDNKVEMVMNKS